MNLRHLYESVKDEHSVSYKTWLRKLHRLLDGNIRTTNRVRRNLGLLAPPTEKPSVSRTSGSLFGSNPRMALSNLIVARRSLRSAGSAAIAVDASTERLLAWLDNAESRFWASVDRARECWYWTGARGNWGYGRFHVAGKQVGAHRLAYELSVGPIPDGWAIDHLCRNRLCVNPAHLEAVTPAENNRRTEPFRSDPRLVMVSAVESRGLRSMGEQRSYLRADGSKVTRTSSWHLGDGSMTLCGRSEGEWEVMDSRWLLKPTCQTCEETKARLSGLKPEEVGLPAETGRRKKRPWVAGSGSTKRETEVGE